LFSIALKILANVALLIASHLFGNALRHHLAAAPA
jgi:hypothetical protein